MKRYCRICDKAFISGKVVKLISFPRFLYGLLKGEVKMTYEKMRQRGLFIERNIGCPGHNSYTVRLGKAHMVLEK